MRRNIAWISVALFTVLLLQSCSSAEKCPAYGSVTPEAVEAGA